MKHALLILIGLLTAFAGCTGKAIRTNNQENIEAKAVSLESQIRLVGDIATPFGTQPIPVEGIGLVMHLAGTGSDPAPSPERTALLEDMHARGVVNPNQVLASRNTSLVIVRGLIPPGAQKGDVIDIEIRLPAQSETTSLRGGWLMTTRLQEMLIVSNRIREGHVQAEARGHLLVDPATGNEELDAGILRKAKVLGGGTVRRERQFGLGLRKEDNQSLAAGVRISQDAGEAINKRFHRMIRGTREGVATPKNDGFIELSMHPRYKENVARYLRVVRSIPMNERPAELSSRLELLERQLLNPITAGNAAIRLEAIGKSGVKTLEKGLESTDPEVQFYSAEALAYMNEPIAAVALGKAAREEPAFRAFALTALSSLNDISSEDQLLELINTESAETRYGAFRALRAMNPRHASIRGEKIGDQFSYHRVKSTGNPIVHVTRNKRAEIVLFGDGHALTPPLLLQAGPTVTVTSTPDNQISVSRFAVGQPDQKRVVSQDLDEVLKAVIEVGGTYPDIVDMLQQARQKKVMTSRFEVEALAEYGREYDRRTKKGQDSSEEWPDEEDEDKPRYNVTSPIPNLFSTKNKK